MFASLPRPPTQCMRLRDCRRGLWVHAATASKTSQQTSLKPRLRSLVCAASEEKVDSKLRTPAAAPTKVQQQQDQSRQPAANSQPPQPTILQQIQQQWNRLDTPQKGYAVVAGLVLLTLLPQVITLLVLLIERLLIGGLLALEEVLLQCIIKGGAVLGAIALVGVIVAGLYLFSSKATK